MLFKIWTLLFAFLIIGYVYAAAPTEKPKVAKNFLNYLSSARDNAGRHRRSSPTEKPKVANGVLGHFAAARADSGRHRRHSSFDSERHEIVSNASMDRERKL